jgi:hypothetical protein
VLYKFLSQLTSHQQTPDIFEGEIGLARGESLYILLSQKAKR